MFARFIIIAIVGLLTFQQGCAQMNNLNTKPVGYFNVKFKTLGGMQFWTDVIHFHHWRIQRNVISGHFRLIDANNIRHAWGNFAHCEQKLRTVAIEKNMPPMRGTVVIMLHGLGRTRASLKSMGQLIHEKSRVYDRECQLRQHARWSRRSRRCAAQHYRSNARSRSNSLRLPQPWEHCC